jgi:hypothetical protein
VAGDAGHVAADRLRFPEGHQGPSAVSLPRPIPPRGAPAGHTFGNSYADTRFDASARGQRSGPSFPTRPSGRPPFDAPPRR